MEYVKKEAVQDALERGLKEMQQYAEDHSELRNGFVDYFRYGNTNRIIHHIATSRISPWVVYNCASGVDFLSKLDEAQLELVMPFIDPAYWNRKFKDYDDDADWVKEVLKAANL
jgi:uroporphyrinogen-III decarboxylase